LLITCGIIRPVCACSRPSSSHHTTLRILCSPDVVSGTHRRERLTRNPAARRIEVEVVRDVERARMLLGSQELGDHGHELRLGKQRRGRDCVRARHALHKAAVRRRLSISHIHMVSPPFSTHALCSYRRRTFGGTLQKRTSCWRQRWWTTKANCATETPA